MEDPGQFQVVVNLEGQYSVWPVHKRLPDGWKATSGPATRDLCLEEIRRAWTDARPLSLCLRMRGDLHRTRLTDVDQWQPCVHELFEAQVEKTPSAVALMCGDRELTFGELNTQANRGAHYLQRHGAMPEVLVGVCLEDPIEIVVASLAVLKSGAAYLPLDSDLPPARLRSLIRDSGASVVLTEGKFESRLQELDTQVVRFSEAFLEAVGCPENPASGADPENAALVIFTSGSSGRPKAVIKTHQNVSARRGLDGYGRDAVVCNLMSPSYGFFAGRLFPTLSCGVPLVLIAHDHIGHVQELVGTLSARGVTHISTVPAFLQELLRQDPGTLSRLAALQSIELGGDALLPYLVEQAGRALPWVRIRQGWGATEAGWAIAGEVERKPDSRVVPVGRPVGDTRVFVLDAHMDPVPTGEVGELYVASDQVVRGYLDRPDATAEKFLPNPFSAFPGERMYRTGDHARVLPTGEIVLSGRIDRMVKIRGYRVEPREVEDTLVRHPGVREAVVGVHGPGEEKRLVAYVVPEDSWMPDDGALRSFIMNDLPDYMVPASFFILDRLPRTAHGKTDWNALQSGCASRREPRQTYLPPRNPEEQQLAQIWARLFRLERVGIRDDFFELGGDSLLAARLLTELGTTFRTDISPSILLTERTIEQLARVVSQPDSPRPSSRLIPIETRGSGTPFFWLHGEASDPLLPRYLGSDQPLYAIPHQAEDGRHATHTTVEEMAASNIEGIRAVQEEGPYLLGGYCFGGLVAFEMAHQLREAGQAVALLALVSPIALPDAQSALLRAEVPTPYAGIRRHAGALARLGYREWGPYVLSRVAGKLTEAVAEVIQWSREGARSLTCHVCLRLGYTLPPGMRSDYILSVYKQALRDYEPKPWPGKIVVLRGKDDPRDLGAWKRLAVGGFEVREFPGDHHSILREPHIASLAKNLNRYLHPHRKQRRVEEASPDTVRTAVSP